MAFAIALVPVQKRQRYGQGRCVQMSGDDSMKSPASIARAWNAGRRAKSASDLVSKRHVSVLIISNKCERALLAERLLHNHACARSRSRRLLIHSAGLQSSPGAALPHALLRFAAARGIAVPEAQPCARFDPTADFDFYDLLLAVDRDVLQATRSIAERQARIVSGSLAEWERKIRLLTDIEGKFNLPNAARILDIPRFEHVIDHNTAVNSINLACVRALESLIRRGL